MYKSMAKLLDFYLPPDKLMRQDQEMLLKYSWGVDIAVNLGVYMGGSCVLLSFGAKKVYGIDIFEQNKELCFRDIKCTLEKVEKDLNNRPNIKLIQGYTDKTYKINNVGLLFIDGGHTRKQVKKDFEAWFPKVRGGGIIIFHDSNFNTNVTDVAKYIADEIAPRHNKDIKYLETMGVSTAWQKKED